MRSYCDEELGNDVLLLSVRWALRRIAYLEAFLTSMELIKKLVGVLARNQSHAVHSGVLRSQRFPRAAVERFAQGCPRALFVFWPIAKCLACEAADNGA